MIKNSITRFLYIIGIGAVLILVSSLLLRQYGPNVKKSTSPNNEYTVAHNSIAKTIRVLDKKGKVLHSETAYENIKFFWSADSQYLALVYQGQGPNVGSVSKIIKMKDGEICAYYVPWSAIEIYIGQNVHMMSCSAYEFVDGHSVLVNFTAYFEIEDQRHHGSGTFIFDIESNSARDVSPEWWGDFYLDLGT